MVLLSCSSFYLHAHVIFMTCIVIELLIVNIPFIDSLKYQTTSGIESNLKLSYHCCCRNIISTANYESQKCASYIIASVCTPMT